MTFNGVVWKMMKVNYKRYLMYFACNAFAVLFLFLFLSIYYNHEIDSMKQSDAFDTVLAPPTAALILFMWFFVQKAHQLFIKDRKSEFGVFMGIGVSPKQIGRLVLFEGSIVSILALVVGLIGGAITSKLFFLLLSTFTKISAEFYHLSFTMFALTTLIYLFIFGVTVSISIYQIQTQSLVSAIQSKQVIDVIHMKNPNYGYFGIALITVSILGLYFTYLTHEDLLFMWAMLTFLGLYLFLSNAIYTFTSLIKGNSSLYFKSILLFSSLTQKQKKLSSLLTLTSIMIMLTTLYCTIMLAIANEEYKRVLDYNLSDLSYIETEHYNTISDANLLRLFEKENSPITEMTTIPTVEFSQLDLYGVSYYNITSINTYNEIFGKNAQLADDEFFLYMNQNREYVGDGELDAFSTFQLGQFELKHKGTKIENRFTTIGQSNTFIVINHNVWSRYLHENYSNLRIQHHIQVADWKESFAAVQALENYFNERNPINESIDERIFPVASKIMDYNSIKSQNAVVFYLLSYLSLIFYVGAFTLLYLNLLADIELEKIKFEKLNKIGITKKEVKHQLTWETLILFFLPTILGIALAFLYLIAMAQDVGGLFNNWMIVGYFALMSCIYVLIQFVFYQYAKSKLFKKVWGSLEK